MSKAQAGPKNIGRDDPIGSHRRPEIAGNNCIHKCCVAVPTESARVNAATQAATKVRARATTAAGVSPKSPVRGDRAVREHSGAAYDGHCTAETVDYVSPLENPVGAGCPA